MASNSTSTDLIFNNLNITQSFIIPIAEDVLPPPGGLEGSLIFLENGYDGFQGASGYFSNGLQWISLGIGYQGTQGGRGLQGSIAAGTQGLQGQQGFSGRGCG